MSSKEISYYSDAVVQKRGKRDGRDWRWEPFWPFRKPKQSDPPIDQKEPTEYEKELVKCADENLNRILQNWSESEKRLHKNCLNAEDKYKHIDADVGRDREDHKDAVKEYEDAKATFYNQPLPAITATVFLILFCIITTAEASFNALVFAVFGQDQFHTYIMAIGVMFAIPWLSHFVGGKLRMEQKSNTTIGLMIVAAVVTFSGILVVAIAREKFFEANKIVETLGIKWDTNNIVLTFLVVNIVLFIAIVILSYEAGHKKPSEFKQARRGYEDAAKKLKQERGEIDQSVEALAEAKAVFNKAHTERTKEFEKVKYQAEEEKDKWAGLVQTYRAANMEARRDKAKPESFNTDLETQIKIPDILVKLECGNCCFNEERK